MANIINMAGQNDSLCLILLDTGAIFIFELRPISCKRIDVDNPFISFAIKCNYELLFGYILFMHLLF